MNIYLRKNAKNLPGKPDIALTKYEIAIFCGSEFFHEIWNVIEGVSNNL
ncbi:MAG: hypothetical protein KIB09_05775 [Firmicutes bacterium]|nr:hypothetical protein [Bacillota bacterium]